MASGLAVVAADVGGIPDILSSEKTGFLVDASDLTAMANTLLTLINDWNLITEIGANAREYVLENHSPEQLPKALSSVYEVATS